MSAVICTTVNSLASNDMKAQLDRWRCQAMRESIGYTEAMNRMSEAEDPVSIIERLFCPIVVDGVRQVAVETQLQLVAYQYKPEMVSIVCDYLNSIGEGIIARPCKGNATRLVITDSIGVYPDDDDNVDGCLLIVDLFSRKVFTILHKDDRLKKQAIHWRDHFVNVGYKSLDFDF